MASPRFLISYVLWCDLLGQFGRSPPPGDLEGIHRRTRLPLYGRAKRLVAAVEVALQVIRRGQAPLVLRDEFIESGFEVCLSQAFVAVNVSASELSPVGGARVAEVKMLVGGLEKP